MAYTLRFPFKLSPGNQLGGLEEPFEVTFNNLTWQLVFESESGYLLKINGLDSEQACHNCLNQLWSGFNWLLLKRGLAVEATSKFNKVSYSSDPEAAARNLERSLGIAYEGPIDGSVNADGPYFYSSEKKIIVCSVGTPNVIISTPVGEAVAFVREGIDIRGRVPSIDDEKLQLALDLFSAYWYEYSDKARLLTLVLALETVIAHPLRHAIVVQLLEKWKPEVEDIKERYSSESDEYIALESLRQELLFKREDSLRRQVRSLVLKSLEFLEHTDARNMASKAVWVYDQRSKLAHEGFLPQPLLSEATSTAKSIVTLVLEARFKGFIGSE